MSLVQFAVAFVLNAILALAFESPVDFALIGERVLPLLYLGICSSGIAYTLQIVGQKDADPTVASIILSLESVFGVIGAAIVHKERMLTREYIGCAVVLFAVVLSQLDFKAMTERIKSKRPSNDNNT